MAQHVAPLAKLALTDDHGHVAFEATQYVTPTLRIRNVNPSTSKELLLELLSQAGHVNTFSLGRAGPNAAIVWARYADAASALGAFLLLYHALVLEGRALLVDFERAGADVFADSAADECVSVPDQYIAPVLDLVAKFNRRSNTNVPKGFQGLRKRFLVPVAPPFARLSFGLSLQLTTDLALHRRAQAALAAGGIGLPPDDPGLCLAPALQGLVTPRALEPEAPPADEVKTEATAPEAAAVPALDADALSAVLAAVAAKVTEASVAKQEAKVPLATAAPPARREPSVPLATAAPQAKSEPRVPLTAAAPAEKRSPASEGAAKRPRTGLYSTAAAKDEQLAGGARAKSEEELYAELYSDPVATSAPAQAPQHAAYGAPAWPPGQVFSPDQAAAQSGLYSPHGGRAAAAPGHAPLYAPSGVQADALYAVPEQQPGAQTQHLYAEHAASGPYARQSNTVGHEFYAAQPAQTQYQQHAAAPRSYGHAAEPQHSWAAQGHAAYGTYGQAGVAEQHHQQQASYAAAPQHHAYGQSGPAGQQGLYVTGPAAQGYHGGHSDAAAAQAWQQQQPQQQPRHYGHTAAQPQHEPAWQGQPQQPAGYGHAAEQQGRASGPTADGQPPLPSEAPPG